MAGPRQGACCGPGLAAAQPVSAVSAQGLRRFVQRRDQVVDTGAVEVDPQAGAGGGGHAEARHHRVQLTASSQIS